MVPGRWSVVGVTAVGGLWSVAGRWAVVLYYANKFAILDHMALKLIEYTGSENLSEANLLILAS